MKKDSIEYEITCRMFDVLATRASQSNGPRINTKVFGRWVGHEWDCIEYLIVLIERYCHEKDIRSLSALVVLPSGDDVSFPGKWFGQYIQDIIKKKIPEWKHPLTLKQKEWHYKYWPQLRKEWKTIDIHKKAKDFREWLTHEDWFEWPSTMAPLGPGEITSTPMHSDGLFSYLEYHVGKTGAQEEERRDILDRIFGDELPRINSDEYMAEFGKPKSPQRLQKMANFLAAEARNYARNQTSDYSEAISDYKSDLDYLYEKYYVREFRFDQPGVGFDWPDLSDIAVKTESSPKKVNWKIIPHEAGHAPDTSTNTHGHQPQPTPETEPKPTPPEPAHPVESEDPVTSPMEDEENKTPWFPGSDSPTEDEKTTKPEPSKRSNKPVVAVAIAIIIVVMILTFIMKASFVKANLRGVSFEPLPDSPMRIADNGRKLERNNNTHRFSFVVHPKLFQQA